jgi:hypothetical protein
LELDRFGLNSLLMKQDVCYEEILICGVTILLCPKGFNQASKQNNKFFVKESFKSLFNLLFA